MDNKQTEEICRLYFEQKPLTGKIIERNVTKVLFHFRDEVNNGQI